MALYKVCVYTNTSRMVFNSDYHSQVEAHTAFHHACVVYNELPIDAICAIERNNLTVEAYRFTRTFDTFRVDPESPSFAGLKARRVAQFSHYFRDSFDDILPNEVSTIRVLRNELRKSHSADLDRIQQEALLNPIKAKRSVIQRIKGIIQFAVQKKRFEA